MQGPSIPLRPPEGFVYNHDVKRPKRCEKITSYRLETDMSKLTRDLDLEEWIEGRSEFCATAMAGAISATHLKRSRPAFGQAVIPAIGSVLASPVIADWDPEPDYFFHWIRDSAVVMRTVVELMEDAATEPARRRWRGHFDDFVRFSLALRDLDGARVLSAGDRPGIR